MIFSEVKKVCPEAIILPSDYETYSLFSVRMFEILRRFSPDVEEYSIDEAFVDLTGLRRPVRSCVCLVRLTPVTIHRHRPIFQDDPFQAQRRIGRIKIERP